MFSVLRKVCVVGGGPAGLAAAIALRQRRFQVTVVDCAVPPIDKACGEGLMPDSIAALRELGIEVPADLGSPFRGIRFADRRSSVYADFPTGCARGVRRTVLHDLLVEEAKRGKIEMIWNAKHVQLAPGGVSVGRYLLRSDYVIGADGQNSRLRRQAHLQEFTREKRRYGFRRHFRVAPWSCYMELHWGARCQIYVTPISPDEVCVAAISSDPKLRLDDALEDFPELHGHLRHAEPLSAEMGALSVSRTLKSVYRDNVALIGDASGSVDAITGEGICLSLRQARALAAAIDTDNLEQYQREHRKLMKRPQTMASLMLMLGCNAELQRRALAGLAHNPKIFQSLLAVHVGAAQFSNLWSWDLLRFGRGFLAA